MHWETNNFIWLTFLRYYLYGCGTEPTLPPTCACIHLSCSILKASRSTNPDSMLHALCLVHICKLDQHVFYKSPLPFLLPTDLICSYLSDHIFLPVCLTFMSLPILAIHSQFSFSNRSDIPSGLTLLPWAFALLLRPLPSSILWCPQLPWVRNSISGCCNPSPD